MVYEPLNPFRVHFVLKVGKVISGARRLPLSSKRFPSASPQEPASQGYSLGFRACRAHRA